MTGGDADEILGGERRLDEDFGEWHAAPRNIVIAFGARRTRVVQENHVPVLRPRFSASDQSRRSPPNRHETSIEKFLQRRDQVVEFHTQRRFGFVDADDRWNSASIEIGNNGIALGRHIAPSANRSTLHARRY